MSLGPRGRRCGRDLRAHRQFRKTIGRRQRHQLESHGISSRRAQQRSAAHKIGLLAFEGSRQTDIARQGGAVGVGADVNEAFLGAHDFQRFDSVGDGIKLTGALPQAS